eukprot:gnl/TRDRNA2_/TRDRNA2_170766_c0_seq2.p1 gnl/TRDRNA2_/TRDRNA2_170766_c0~~gnl/TRDRNA2_/TRDRNA2_170766_c0_seq2.p1  ORF type:complete len:689 (-),score=123.37 gnl/TRDRNA2_/TRDRNA2_170766_c0_seq2:81-2147(-)
MEPVGRKASRDLARLPNSGEESQLSARSLERSMEADVEIASTDVRRTRRRSSSGDSKGIGSMSMATGTVSLASRRIARHISGRLDAEEEELEGNEEEDMGEMEARISFAYHMWRKSPLVNHLYDSGLSNSKFIFSADAKTKKCWDVLILLGVSWTIFIAPAECAILEVYDAVYLVEVCANSLFALDILVNFNTAFEKTDVSGTRNIFNRDEIAERYIRTYLAFDILCAMPLHFISKQTIFFRLVRMLRLLRVLKLKRSGLFRRLDIPFAILTISKCMILILICSHWLACIMAALVTMDEDDNSWADALIAGKLTHDKSIKNDPLTLYAWSFYFAVTLLSTVGLGDLTPQTTNECIAILVCVTVGSTVWAFILSSLIDVIRNMNPHRSEFERTLDQLNGMMTDHDLPDELKKVVRNYFKACEDLWKQQKRTKLLNRMSLSLQGRVSLALATNWIDKVPYFRVIFEQNVPNSTLFITDISKAFVPMVFPNGETLSCIALYLVRKGALTWGGQIKIAGDVCGEDMLLDNVSNRMAAPLALSMTSTLALKRTDFDEVLLKFPEHAKVVRKYVVWLVVRQGMLNMMKRRKRSAQQGGDGENNEEDSNGKSAVFASAVLRSASAEPDRAKGKLSTGSTLLEVLQNVEAACSRLMERQKAGAEQQAEIFQQLEEFHARRREEDGSSACKRSVSAG